MNKVEEARAMVDAIRANHAFVGPLDDRLTSLAHHLGLTLARLDAIKARCMEDVEDPETMMDDVIALCDGSADP